MKVIAHGNMKEGGSVYTRILSSKGSSSIRVIEKNIELKGFFEWTSLEGITYLVEGEGSVLIEIHDYDKEAFSQLSYSKWGTGHDSQPLLIKGYMCKVFYLPQGIFTLLDHKKRN